MYNYWDTTWITLFKTFEKVNDEIVDIDNGELLKGSIDKENIFIAKGKIPGVEHWDIDSVNFVELSISDIFLEILL